MVHAVVVIAPVQIGMMVVRGVERHVWVQRVVVVMLVMAAAVAAAGSVAVGTTRVVAASGLGDAAVHMRVRLFLVVLLLADAVGAGGGFGEAKSMYIRAEGGARRGDHTRSTNQRLHLLLHAAHLTKAYLLKKKKQQKRKHTE